MENYPFSIKNCTLLTKIIFLGKGVEMNECSNP